MCCTVKTGLLSCIVNCFIRILTYLNLVKMLRRGTGIRLFCPFGLPPPRPNVFSFRVKRDIVLGDKDARPLFSLPTGTLIMPPRECLPDNLVCGIGFEMTGGEPRLRNVLRADEKDGLCPPADSKEGRGVSGDKGALEIVISDCGEQIRRRGDGRLRVGAERGGIECSGRTIESLSS